jgi:hypothetical protein
MMAGRRGLTARYAAPGRRLLRLGLVAALVAPLGACGGASRPAPEPEGRIAFRTAAGVQSESRLEVVPGPAFRRPGLLTPPDDPGWRSAWIGPDPDKSTLRGAEGGFAAGLGILTVAPAALVFWPAAVGIMAATTAAGALGESFGMTADSRMSPPDRQVIAEATMSLQPDRLWRESVARAFGRRVGNPLPVVPCPPGCGLQDDTADVLAQVEAQGLDGAVLAWLEAIGLAAGMQRDTYGVFVQVRVRAMEIPGGRLRYDRVISYGPGQTPAGLPPADIHTLEFLAADQAFAYRHIAAETIRRVARLATEDSSLPLPVRLP